MILETEQLKIETEDARFNSIYPIHIKKLSERHWTPVEVAKLASDFLVHKPKCKVLDIGSGVGKFCLIGATSTDGRFYGVEQRAELVKLSQRIAETHHINNVEFINSNVTEISFSNFDAFYFYNPFYENIDDSLLIDNKLVLDEKLYFAYTEYVVNQLKQTPVGTRLVTYWSMNLDIPEGFILEFTAYNGKLDFWEKKF